MTLSMVRQSQNLTPLIGATTESAATDHTSTSGLNGLLKAILRDFRARIPSLSNGAIPVTLNASSSSSVTLASVNVTVTSAVLFASNANRMGWSVEHKSGVGEAYVAEGAAATSANGITVAPDYELTMNFLFTGVINVIGSANCTLRTTEYNR